MHKRIKAICKYYNNLEYNKINKEKALNKIFTLTKNMQLKNIKLFDRFSVIATLMKDNLSIFQSVCDHVDIVTDIIQALNEIDTKLITGKFSEEESVFHFYFTSLMIFIYNIWNEDQMHVFFEDNILKDINLDCSSIYNDLKNLKKISLQSCNEMILLQDSDLYAVISYLMITRKFHLNKIWVQEQIKEKFLSLLRKNCFDFPIHVFRFKEDLLTTKINCRINITSIWSENIIAAKNLAFSLHKEIVHINTHMEIYCIRPIPPHVQMYARIIRDVFLLNIASATHFNFKVKKSENMDNIENYPFYNPFYNGVWKFMQNKYIFYKGSAWAHITLSDIKNCIYSAIEGYKIWTTMPFNLKMQILSNFIFTLECNGKLLLAKVISKLIKDLSYLSENQTVCFEKGRFEVTVEYKGTGVIFLKEENEITLFSKLIQSLITGNSVIVLCDANSCNMTPYCNMFASAEIPPGVINMLPSEGLENLEQFLFDKSYAHYINSFFVKNQHNNVTEKLQALKCLSTMKQIIVPVE